MNDDFFIQIKLIRSSENSSKINENGIFENFKFFADKKENDPKSHWWAGDANFLEVPLLPKN